MEQKFKDFLNQYNGKFVEVVDPSSKYQCFDLADAWLDFLGIPKDSIAHYYAYQIYTDATDRTRQFFDLIPNTPDGVPQVGDVVIFGKQVGIAGHVCIRSNGQGDANAFESFDQNWPTGSPAHLQQHNYVGVLGWLRPKINLSIPTPIMDSNWKQIQDYAKGKFLVNEAKDVIKYIEDLDAYRKSESAAKDQKQREIETLQTDNGKLSEQMDEWIKTITAEGLDPQNFQSSLHELLAKKDEECKTKIQAIQDIPPKVEEKVVEMPYQAQSAVYKAIIELLVYLDKKSNGKKSG